MLITALITIAPCRLRLRIAFTLVLAIAWWSNACTRVGRHWEGAKAARKDNVSLMTGGPQTATVINFSCIGLATQGSTSGMSGDDKFSSYAFLKNS